MYVRRLAQEELFADVLEFALEGVERRVERAHADVRARLALDKAEVCDPDALGDERFVRKQAVFSAHGGVKELNLGLEGIAVLIRRRAIDAFVDERPDVEEDLAQVCANPHEREHRVGHEERLLSADEIVFLHGVSGLQEGHGRGVEEAGERHEHDRVHGFRLVAPVANGVLLALEELGGDVEAPHVRCGDGLDGNLSAALGHTDALVHHVGARRGAGVEHDAGTTQAPFVLLQGGVGAGELERKSPQVRTVQDVRHRHAVEHAGGLVARRFVVLADARIVTNRLQVAIGQRLGELQDVALKFCNLLRRVAVHEEAAVEVGVDEALRARDERQFNLFDPPSAFHHAARHAGEGTVRHVDVLVGAEGFATQPLLGEAEVGDEDLPRDHRVHGLHGDDAAGGEELVGARLQWDESVVADDLALEMGQGELLQGGKGQDVHGASLCVGGEKMPHFPLDVNPGFRYHSRILIFLCRCHHSAAHALRCVAVARTTLSRLRRRPPVQSVRRFFCRTAPAKSVATTMAAR